MKKTPLYKVVYYCDSELRFSSYLFTALSQLARDNVIQLKYQIPLRISTPKEAFCSLIEVTNYETGLVKKIAFDWSDSPRTVLVNKLHFSDCYYKRNFIPDITNNYCPADEQFKLHPLGPIIQCRAKNERPLWVRALSMGYNTDKSIFQQRFSLARIKKVFRSVRTPLTLLFEDEYFPLVDIKQRPLILFQTRAYDPKVPGNPHDSEEITVERADLIRALKKEFGQKAIAGFTPSDYVRRDYADLVINENIEQRKYLDLVKTASICVYSRGLNDSPANKLAEYMAAGKCVVSQEIPTLFPQPLENNKHLVIYTSAQDMVEKCHQLLADHALRFKFESEAFRYYKDNISPKGVIRKILANECS